MQAMLRRSRAIARFIDAPVDFLTFGFQTDLSRVVDDLRSQGSLSTEINVRNMWDILAAAVEEAHVEDYGSDCTYERRPSELNLPSDVSTTDTGIRRIRYVEGEGVAGVVDYTRPDGSLFVRDMRSKSVTKEHRGVHLIARDLRVIETWRTKTDMFAWLLTKFLGAEQSLIIVDNPSVANSIAENGYLTPKSILVKYYHSNHSEVRKNMGFGVLRTKHKSALDRADVFDVNVFPTQAQREAAGSIVGRTPDTVAVGNVVELPAEVEAKVPRDETLAVVISRLVPSKNVDHAVLAVIRANRLIGQSSALSKLEIFGRGGTRNDLERLIRDSSAAQYIGLKGYTTDVYREFHRASFSVLPTGQEAFGLSIVESMACGCIPIAYDVPFGPGDIITDGVDGFLVPFGDIEGLTNKILKLREMDESTLEEMRDAARTRSKDFSSEDIGRKWADVVQSAWNRKLKSSSLDLKDVNMAVHRVKLKPNGLTAALSGRNRRDQTIEVELKTRDSENVRQIGHRRVFMCLRGRQNNLRIRIPGTIQTARKRWGKEPSTSKLEFPLPFDLLSKLRPGIIDLYLRINDGTNIREIRVPATGLNVSRLHIPAGLKPYKTVKGNLSFKASEKA